MNSPLKSLILASASLAALSASAQVYFDGFDTDTSATFSGGAIYDGTGGVGGTGAIILNNNVQASAKAFGIDIGVTVAVDTDYEFSFDAKILSFDVFHMFVTPFGGAQQNFFAIQGEMNTSTFSNISKTTTLPAGTTSVSVRFEAVTGAVENPLASFAIDNFTVTDTSAPAIPEPSAAAALFGLAAIGFAAVRRRRA